MRRWLSALLLLAFAAPSPVLAIGDTPLQPLLGTAQYGLSVSGVTSLTPPAVLTALYTNVCVDGSVSVRYTSDGTTPSATTGILLQVSQCAQFYGNEVAANLKFYPASGTGKINVEYYR